MTTKDNNLWAELVCSTEHARRRSRNSRKMSRSKHVAVQKFVKLCIGFSLATNSPAIQCRIFQNAAIKTNFDCFFFNFSHRPVSFHLLFFIFFFGLPNYVTDQYIRSRRGKTVHTPDDQKQQKVEYIEQFQSWRSNNSIYGNPPKKTGAALRFRQLRPVFLQVCWRSKAALKPKTSSTRCCWDNEGGLVVSKRLFTGLCLIFFFFNFPEETRWLLGPGVLMERTLRGTSSTRPSSTILEILTPYRDAECSADGLIPPTAYHCSCESLTAIRRSTAWFTHTQTSASTFGRDVVSKWLQGSITALLVILSQIAADSVNIAMPESKKSFLRVKCEILDSKQSTTHFMLINHHTV